MTARDFLAAVQQRADAATDGPWTIRPDGFMTCVETWPGEDLIVEYGKVADHEFIAAARSDVPRLVAALTAALNVRDRVAAWHNREHDMVTGGMATPEARDALARVYAELTHAIEAALTEEES